MRNIISTKHHYIIFQREKKPDFQTSQSLDPKLLQRPPSDDTIRNLAKTNTEKMNDELKDVFIKEWKITDLEIDEYIENDAEVVSDHVNCIECVNVIPVFSADDLEPGDHFILYGAAHNHHGIIARKSEDGEIFEIIEASNTWLGASSGASQFFGGKAAIKLSSKKFDFKTEKICVVVYRHRYTKMQTIERAQNEWYFEKKSKKYKYDLLINNCEHFATFCVTGKGFSVHMTKLKLTCRLFLSSGFVGISDELERNDKMHENKIICEDCFQMNKKLLGVTVKPIVNGEDIEKGDIIRYSYWNLWHEAVVTEKMKTTKSSVECKIAHYAFCGLFSHRTIREEKLLVQLKGQYLKLNYTPPAYYVYKPDEVVERARRRIGEQMFVFFSNDSSHFARWCKLKRHR